MELAKKKHTSVCEILAIYINKKITLDKLILNLDPYFKLDLKLSRVFFGFNFRNLYHQYTKIVFLRAQIFY